MKFKEMNSIDLIVYYKKYNIIFTLLASLFKDMVSFQFCSLEFIFAPMGSSWLPEIQSSKDAWKRKTQKNKNEVLKVYLNSNHDYFMLKSILTVCINTENSIPSLLRDMLVKS